MNELKPVAWRYQSSNSEDCSMSFMRWTKRESSPSWVETPLYAIPDTHRVVSVETLQRLLQETLYYASKKELQAIIDNKVAT